MPETYDDILNLPHPVSRMHAHLPREKRAAQFAPFAALTGYDAALSETARATESFRAPEGDALDELNACLTEILAAGSDAPPVTLTYFEPDVRKAGGAYRQTTGRIVRLDRERMILHLDTGVRLPVQWVSGICREQ